MFLSSVFFLFTPLSPRPSDARVSLSARWLTAPFTPARSLAQTGAHLSAVFP